MSELSDAAKTITAAAARADITTNFFDEVTTAGVGEYVTNSNNGLTVPSIQTQVKELYDEDGNSLAPYASQAEAARDEAVAAQVASEDAFAAVEASSLAAQSARDEAVSSKDLAETASSEAIAAKDAALISQTESETARDESVAAKDIAVSSQAASESASASSIAAQALSESARDSSVAAQSASESAASDAIDASNLSVTAKNEAVVAKDLAEDAQAASESARFDSIEAKSLAVTAQGESETARDEAVVAKNASELAQSESQSARDASELARDESVAAKDIAVAAKDETLERTASYEVETTEYLINTFDGSALSVGDVVKTLGFYEKGSTGGASWVKTGNSISPSTVPFDNYTKFIDSPTISDSVGFEYELIINGDISADKIGAIPSDSIDSYGPLNVFFSCIRYRAKFGQITAPNVLEDGAVSAHIPSGRYYCSRSLDGTNIRGVGWSIMAHGATIYSTDAGYPAVDLLGSRWGTIVGLKAIGDETLTPRTGIQYGRIITASYSCDNMHFDRCKTDGYFSLSGVYNLASETDTHIHPEYYNSFNSQDSYCLVNDGNNFWEATSRYVTDDVLSGVTSMSNIQHTFLGGDIRKLSTGSPIWCSKASQTKYYNSYVVSKDSYGVVFSDDGNGFNDTLLDIHFETSGITDCVRFEKQPTSAAAYLNMRNFDFRDHAPFASNSIFSIDDDLSRVVMQDASIKIARLGVVPTNGLTESENKLYIFGSLYAPNSIIKGFRIWGDLKVESISTVATLPYGDYCVTDESGNSVMKGSIKFSSSTASTPSGATLLSGISTSRLGTIELENKSSLGFTATEGVFAVDDGSNWSGANATGLPRPIFYDGTAWVAMV